jgi:ubiquinone/menaquinone biosynthesis C-methylase UbiE
MQERVWENEYKKPTLVTMGTEPQVAVKDFLRWLRRDQKIPLENLNVLDLGCGNGKNANYIGGLDSTNEVTGIDISDTALSHARTYAPSTKNVTYLKQSIGETLPFTDGTFSVALDVTSSNSLNEKERATFLKETSRVLKPKSFFFVRALCKDGDANAKTLLKTNPGPEKDTYIMPEFGLVERVFSKEDFIATYSPLFTILKLEKETHYTKFSGRLYKRNFWIGYLQKV